MGGVGSEEDGDRRRPERLRAAGSSASQTARVGRACDVRDMRAIVSQRPWESIRGTSTQRDEPAIAGNCANVLETRMSYDQYNMTYDG